MRQDTVEGSRDTLEVKRLDKEHRVFLFAVPHEAVQLFLQRPGAVRGLLLICPERAQLALLLEHALHAVRPHCPRQFVLEVARTGVEPSALEIVAIVASQSTQEMPLLAGVVDPRKSGVAVLPEEARQIPVPAHRYDGDTLGVEIPTTATRERLDGAAIARAFNEHYATEQHTGIRSARRQAARCPE